MATVTEIANILGLTIEQARALTRYYSGAVERVTEILDEEMFELVRAAMTESPASEALEKARDLSNTAARSLSEQLTESQLNSIGETIAQAIEMGKRPLDIAPRLKEVTMLDGPRAKRYMRFVDSLEQSGMSSGTIEKKSERYFQKLLRERRRTIARTEGRTATSYARDANAREREARWKAWITSQDDRVSEDICMANEAAGVIPIDEDFPSGASVPPGHPNCRCTISYITQETALDAARRAADERSERTATAKEA